MASKVKKVCISLSQESLAQLDWLTEEVFKEYFPIDFSKQMREVISYAYFAAKHVREG